MQWNFFFQLGSVDIRECLRRAAREMGETEDEIRIRTWHQLRYGWEHRTASSRSGEMCRATASESNRIGGRQSWNKRRWWLEPNWIILFLLLLFIFLSCFLSVVGSFIHYTLFFINLFIMFPFFTFTFTFKRC